MNIYKYWNETEWKTTNIKRKTLVDPQKAWRTTDQEHLKIISTPKQCHCAGTCEALFWQKLTCPYEVKYKSLPRVWCQQNSAECCTGLTFSHSERLVDGGKLKVTQDVSSFTVEVLEPNHKQGVYWCGLLSRNGTIIKLAEGYIHNCKHKMIFQCYVHVKLS